MSLSFLDLPAEVHREIWEFVPFQGWITLSLVNRQIQHLTRVEPSWPEVVLLFDGEPCPLNWLQRHGKVWVVFLPHTATHKTLSHQLQAVP